MINIYSTPHYKAQINGKIHLRVKSGVCKMRMSNCFTCREDREKVHWGMEKFSHPFAKKVGTPFVITTSFLLNNRALAQTRLN